MAGTELLDSETMQGEAGRASVLDVMEAFPALDTVVGWGRKVHGECWTTYPITSPLGSLPFLCYIFSVT